MEASVQGIMESSLTRLRQRGRTGTRVALVPSVEELVVEHSRGEPGILLSYVSPDAELFMERKATDGVM